MVSHSCGITDYIRLLYKATIYHLFIDNHSVRLFRLKLVYLYEPDNGRLELSAPLFLNMSQLSQYVLLHFAVVKALILKNAVVDCRNSQNESPFLDRQLQPEVKCKKLIVFQFNKALSFFPSYIISKISNMFFSRNSNLFYLRIFIQVGAVYLQIKVFMVKINQPSFKLTTKAQSFSSVFFSSYSPVLGDRSAVVFVVILLLKCFVVLTVNIWSFQLHLLLEPERFVQG